MHLPCFFYIPNVNSGSKCPRLCYSLKWKARLDKLIPGLRALGFLGAMAVACEMHDCLREDTQDSPGQLKALISEIQSRASPSIVLQNLLVFVAYWSNLNCSDLMQLSP